MHSLFSFVVGLSKAQRRSKKGPSCVVCEVGPFFLPVQIMLGPVPDVSTLWGEGLLEPLTVDRR